ncbi:hypothetical protein P7M05_23455, partial [Vibrio parahaemolyticus]|nr:hypothetical protein [Vibrio parahaemolyticus]
DASVTVIRGVSTVSRRAAASKCEFWLSEGRGASDDTEILAGNYVSTPGITPASRNIRQRGL